MTRAQRQTVLLALIDRLWEKGGWCGAKHLQHSTFFLQELLGVPLDLNVIFYKLSPHSFDLDDEVTALRGDLLVRAKDLFELSCWCVGSVRWRHWMICG